VQISGTGSLQLNGLQLFAFLAFPDGRPVSTFLRALLARTTGSWTGSSGLRFHERLRIEHVGSSVRQM